MASRSAFTHATHLAAHDFGQFQLVNTVEEIDDHRQVRRVRREVRLPPVHQLEPEDDPLLPRTRQLRDIRIFSVFWRGQRDTRAVLPAVNPGPTGPNDHYRPVS
jgi:hypothetical protein